MKAIILALLAFCFVAESFRGLSAHQRVVGASLSKRFSSVVDDKKEVTEYFNTEGFSRWNKIYSDSDEVNKVQLDIRTGHQQTIDKVLNWVDSENNAGKTICDAGCGVGSLALPLAKKFKKVFASDISSSMTTEASRRAKDAKLNNVVFEVKDMEALKGQFDTVTCIDVMIHYPTDKVMSSYFDFILF